MPTVTFLCADCKCHTVKLVMIAKLPMCYFQSLLLRTICSSTSSLAATLYQGHHDRNPELYRKYRNIKSTERYILHNYVGAAGMLLQINGRFTKLTHLMYSMIFNTGSEHLSLTVIHVFKQYIS